MLYIMSQCGPACAALKIHTTAAAHWCSCLGSAQEAAACNVRRGSTYPLLVHMVLIRLVHADQTGTHLDCTSRGGRCQGRGC